MSDLLQKPKEERKWLLAVTVPSTYISMRRPSAGGLSHPCSQHENRSFIYSGWLDIAVSSSLQNGRMLYFNFSLCPISEVKVKCFGWLKPPVASSKSRTVRRGRTCSMDLFLLNEISTRDER